MDYAQITYETMEIMHKNDIDNYSIVFDKRRGRFGESVYYPPTKHIVIHFPEFLTKIRDEKAIDTIKHECAHAIEFRRYGRSNHGRRWKIIVLGLGGSANKTASLNDMLEISDYFRYHVICIKCNKVICYRNRLTEKTKRYIREKSMCHSICGGDIKIIDRKTGKVYI